MEKLELTYKNFTLSNFEFEEPDKVSFDVEPVPTEEEIKDIQEYLLKLFASLVN